MSRSEQVRADGTPSAATHEHTPHALKAGPMLLNGAEIFVDAIGEGPPILMMHGLGIDHTYLRPWHDALADEARVIYYDHRLNGRSSRDVGPADHATWHADALALLDHLEIERAMIYGHSYGAWLAQGFALRHPERVRGLILCGATPAFDYVEEVIAAAQARDPQLTQFFLERIGQPVPTDRAFEEFWQTVLPLYFAGPPNRDLLARTRFSADAFNLGMQCLQGFDTTSGLAKLPVPILVVEGAHDFITPPAHAQRIIDAAPHAQLVVLPASGHFPFVEEPDGYLQALRDFLRRW